MLQWSLIVVVLSTFEILGAPNDIIFTCGSTGATPSGDGAACQTSTNFVQPTEMIYSSLLNALYIVDTSASHVRSLVVGTLLMNAVVGPTTSKNTGDFVPLGANPTAALFRNPTSLAIYMYTLYISDTGNNKIKTFNLQTRVLTLFAGTGSSNFLADVDLLSVQLATPQGVFYDNKRLYVMNSGSIYLHALHESLNLGTKVSFGFIGGLDIIVYRGLGFASATNQNSLYKLSIVFGSTSLFLGGAAGDGVSPSTVAFTSIGAITPNCGRESIFISDAGNKKVKEYSFATGTTSLVVGTGLSTPLVNPVIAGTSYNLGKASGFVIVPSINSLVISDETTGRLLQYSVAAGDVQTCVFTKTRSLSSTFVGRGRGSMTLRSKTRSRIKRSMSESHTHSVTKEQHTDTLTKVTRTPELYTEVTISNPKTPSVFNDKFSFSPSESLATHHTGSKTRDTTRTISRSPIFTEEFTKSFSPTSSGAKVSYSRTKKTWTFTSPQSRSVSAKLTKSKELKTRSRTHSITLTPSLSVSLIARVTLEDTHYTKSRSQTFPISKNSLSFSRDNPFSRTQSETLAQEHTSTVTVTRDYTITETEERTITYPETQFDGSYSMSITEIRSASETNDPFTQSETDLFLTDSPSKTPSANERTQSNTVTRTTTVEITTSLTLSKTVTLERFKTLSRLPTVEESVSMSRTNRSTPTISETRTPWPYPPLLINCTNQITAEDTTLTVIKVQATSVRNGLKITLKISPAMFSWHPSIFQQKSSKGLFSVSYTNETKRKEVLRSGFLSTYRSKGPNFLTFVPSVLGSRYLDIEIFPINDYSAAVAEEIDITFSRYAFIPRAEEWLVTIYLSIEPMNYALVSKEAQAAAQALSLTSALSTNPAAASQAGKIALLMQATDCPNDGEENIDILAHPMQTRIGSEPNVDIHLGSIYCNILLILGFSFVHFLFTLGHYIKWTIFNPTGKVPTTWDHSKSVSRYPTCTVFVYLFLYQSMITSAFYGGMYSTDPTHVGLCWTIFVVLILSLAYLMGITTIWFEGVWVPYEPGEIQYEALYRADGEESFKEWFVRWTTPEGTWEDRLVTHGFCRRYELLFGAFREGRQWWLGVDTSFLVIIGILSGYDPSTKDQCRLVSGFIMCFFIVYAILVVAVRPFATKLDQTFYVIAATLQFMAAAFIFFVSEKGEPVEAAVNGATSCILSNTGLMLLKMIADSVVLCTSTVKQKILPTRGEFAVVDTLLQPEGVSANSAENLVDEIEMVASRKPPQYMLDMQYAAQYYSAAQKQTPMVAAPPPALPRPKRHHQGLAAKAIILL
eukprot:PhF_6_TR13432/c0_g1_i3/m.21435